MEVGQKRERYPTHRLGPVTMAVDTVNAHTQHLGVCPVEFAQKGLNPRDLKGSGGRPVQGIKHQHHVFFALELAEAELLAVQLTRQLEIGRLLSNFDHNDSILSVRID
jgi:hypothetical protein